MHLRSRVPAGIKTPSDFAVAGLSVADLDRLQNRHEIEAIYPATSLQQGFIYHYLSQPQDDAYRVQVLLDYHQALDVAAYQQAWSLASLRYPILRTAFDWQETLLQVITAPGSIGPKNFTFKDISELPGPARDQAINAIQREDREIAFDLSEPGLVRFTLIKQSAEHYTVLKTEHHSIADGWSGPVLLKSVHDDYNRLTRGSASAAELALEVVPESAYLAAQEYYQQHATTTRGLVGIPPVNPGERPTTLTVCSVRLST